MIYQNKTGKIIFFAGKSLLPGETAQFSDSVQKNPNFSFLKERGMIEEVVEMAAEPSAEADTSKTPAETDISSETVDTTEEKKTKTSNTKK